MPQKPTSRDLEAIFELGLRFRKRTARTRLHKYYVLKHIIKCKYRAFAYHTYAVLPARMWERAFRATDMGV